MSFKKNTAVTGFTVGMVSATDGSDITTTSPVGYRTLDGGTQTAIGDTTGVHEGNGQWSFDLTAAEMNGDIVGLTFTHASAITQHFTIKTDTKVVSELNDVGGTAQTGDNFTRIGANGAGLTDLITASGFSTAANLATLDTNVSQIEAAVITNAAGTDIAADIIAIKSETANILVDTGTTLPASLTTLQSDTDNIQTRLPSALVGGKMDSDATAISGDTSAADNLELMFNGTGYTDDTAPASRSQVGNLATGSASISTQSESYVLTTGTQSSGVLADTETLDGTAHQHTDTAGTLELYYQFDVGGSGVATTIDFSSYVTGANDDIDVFAYDWIGASWDQIGTVNGSNSTTYGSDSFSLLTRHTGATTDLGKARIRFQATGLTSAVLSVDQIFLSYAVVSQTVGYANGRIWVNTNAANTTTESYVDGVADNPVSTLASAKTIADALNIKDFHVSSDSSLTMAADLNNYNMYGVGYAVAFSGFDFAGTHFYHVGGASGIVTAQNNSDHFDILDSIIQAMTVDDAHFTNCSFTDNTLTLHQTNSGDIKIIGSRSVVAGANTPVIDCGTAVITHALTISDWQNGLEIRNLNNGGTNPFSISGTGKLIVASTCSGTMNVRGNWEITDNSGGNVTFVYDALMEAIIDMTEDDGAVKRFTVNALENAPSGTGASAATIADAVWDEAQSAHTTAGTFGLYLDTEVSGISGGSGLTAQQTRDAMALSTAATPVAGSIDLALDNIEADTNELQGDNVPGLITALNDVAATDIVSGGAINTTAGAVDTVTANTDMRGTEGANTTTPNTVTPLSAAGVRTALGLATADMDTQLSGNITATGFATLAAQASMQGNVTDILADTSVLQTDLANGGRLDLILDELTAQGDTNEAKIDIMDALIDLIEAKTASLTFTKANELDSNMQSINGVTLTGDGSATPFDV